MSTTSHLAFKFLKELDSNSVQETIGSLTFLMDHLENKDDPEPFELQMFEAAFQTLEKIKTLEGMMRRFVGEKKELNLGNKLQSLYDDSSNRNLFD